MLKNSKLLLIASLFSITTFAADLVTSKIEVISNTPLQGIGLPLNMVPANIQIASPKDINKQSGVSIADFMANNLQGVTVSDRGGNPYQPEINLRGYSASTLLGTPQGISTYIDGVRVNEPFGDVTLWDKIPSFAIGGMQLVPGSNPIYGLNTLGGAIAIQTKNGRDAPGAAIESEFGSWGRVRHLIEYGGVTKDNSIDYYLGYQNSKEDGWRQYSPSRTNQLFSKVGWQNEKSRLELSYMAADNKLNGLGFTPEYLLGPERDQIHTRPDTTDNYSHNFTLNGSTWLNDHTMVSGNAYYRKSNRYTANGDIWEQTVTEVGGSNTGVLPGYTATAAGTSLGVCNNTGTTGGVANTTCEMVGSVMNTTQTRQDTYGIQAQISFDKDLFGKKNLLNIGSGLDYTNLMFGQYEQVNISTAGQDQYFTCYTSLYPCSTHASAGGVFDSTRAVRLAGNGLLPQKQTVGLTGKQYTFSMFAVDTFSLNDQWHLNGGLRWNYTNVDNVDTYNSPGNSASLTGKSSFSRINPTVGLTHTPNKNITLFGNYSESSRAPTSIELGCANPENPCLLPTAMADDPPLKQVVAKTYDFGARGQLTDIIKWNASVYSAVNHNDIQFVRAGTSTSQGYFTNFGRTKREGFDIGLNGRMDKFSWAAAYSNIHATYDSDTNLISSANSSGASDVISIKQGNIMPGISRQQFKLRTEYQLTPQWKVGSNIIGFSKQYAYGNENNAHNGSGCTTAQDNACATGSGVIGGYTIVNLDTQYNFGKGFAMFAKATNIFDKEYNLSARLMATKFGTNGSFDDEDIQVRGLIPGAPRAGWIGVRYEFGGADKKD
jgi:outer membrane receptor protein involved in Fe transport